MRARPRRQGFTLIELLVVMIIIGILASLLLTAVTSAMRTAKNATVAAEIDGLSTALASFKEQHGDYPPSRIILAENGFWDTSSTAARANYLNPGDITQAELATRSLSFLRKVWPRVNMSTSAALFDGSGVFYDFDGNGTMNANPVILQGHECLVFFLGGIPQNIGTTGDVKWAVTGFARNPTNPFVNNVVSNSRSVPLFEFKAGRLTDTDNANGFPGYGDTLGTDRPYAYFSAYGNNRYDPNDMNFAIPEPNDGGSVPSVTRLFRVTHPVQAVTGSDGTGNGGDDHIAISPAPNPYSSGEANAPDKPTQWEKGQSFQIISAGADAKYGVGGQFAGQGATIRLPGELDRRLTPAMRNLNAPDAVSRTSEGDNIANFSGGTLE